MSYESVWKPEIIARLSVLWNEGYSVINIAYLLSTEFSVTISKDAVVGKVHRIGLPARPSPLGRTRHPVLRSALAS